MITNLNHITIGVKDPGRSLAFYVDVLGLHPVAQWDNGVYLQAGFFWICLTVDSESGGMQSGPGHIAFSVDNANFEALSQQITDSGAVIWRKNKSEGKSLYFLDPDGNKLEIHCGNLFSRMESCRRNPFDGMKFFDQGSDEFAHHDPVALMKNLLEEHAGRTDTEVPFACCLSTAGKDGSPNARFVSLKEVKNDALIITGPVNSRKGEEIRTNPAAALTFWWPEARRQIRIQGDARLLNDAEAEVYFHTRSPRARIVNSISRQGEPLTDYDELREKVNEALKKSHTKPQRPPNWGGIAFRPTRIEFMLFDPGRLHRRVLFEKKKNNWQKSMLQP